MCLLSFANDYDSLHVRYGYPKDAQKAPSLPSSEWKWYSYPTAPVESSCRATWSELGDISEVKKETNLQFENRSERPASIADGIPPAAETGEPVPLFDLQVKIRSHSAPGCSPRTGKARRIFGVCYNVRADAFLAKLTKSRRLFSEIFRM